MGELRSHSGDTPFAPRCHTIVEKGEQMPFNQEYPILLSIEQASRKVGKSEKRGGAI